MGFAEVANHIAEETGSFAKNVFELFMPQREELPPPPSMEDINDVIDELSGMKVVTVTDENGVSRRVIKRLDGHEQEKEISKASVELIKSAMDNVTKLYNIDPSSAKRFEPFIDMISNLNEKRTKEIGTMLGGDIPTQKQYAQEVAEFKNMHMQMLERDFDRAGNELHENLVQSGHANSSAAHEMQAHLAAERQLARARVRVQAQEYGDKLTQNRFDRDTNIHKLQQQQKMQDFGLNEKDREARLKASELGYTLGENERKENIANQRDAFNIGQTAINQDLARLQGSAATQMHGDQFKQAQDAWQQNALHKEMDYQRRKDGFVPTLAKAVGGWGAAAAGDAIQELLKKKKPASTTNPNASWAATKAGFEKTLNEINPKNWTSKWRRNGR